MLKPRITKKWIKALRSGKYQQGNGYLCKDDKYCCLGILIAVHFGEDVFLPAKGHGIENVKAFDGKISYLPSDFSDQIGLDYSTEESLIHMNDLDKKTFNEIADYIENNLLPKKESN